ncbi:MAG: hypothetical protein GY679_01720 [Mycoplasma sp.]|nr:hypothetical protein [Mycoplasma sp.]
MIKWNGDNFKVVERERIGCGICFFKGTNECLSKAHKEVFGLCIGMKRADGKSVCFVKVLEKEK